MDSELEEQRKELYSRAEEAAQKHAREIYWDDDESCEGQSDAGDVLFICEDDSTMHLKDVELAVSDAIDGPRRNSYGDHYYHHRNLGPDGGNRYLDMQGYEWPSRKAREEYVASRFAHPHHQPFHNVDHGPDGLRVLEKEFNTVYRPDKSGAESPKREMFSFSRFSRQASPCHFHFQLRNLLAAASATEYYYLERNKVMQYDAAHDSTSVFLDVFNDKRDAIRKCSDLIVSTMCAKEDLLFVGGFSGEIILSSLLSHNIASARVDGTGYESNIVNAAEISQSISGDVQLVLATNCNSVCLYRANGILLDRRIDLGFPANQASVCPTDPRMLAVVGDHVSGRMFDLSANVRIADLNGHLDYAFAVAWHPDGQQFATGSQDKSFRIWDVRKMSQSLDVLPCTHAEVRSMKYSPDGKFLAVAEPLDVVNIYDTSFKRQQALSFFNDISGIAFSPDSSTLMLALQDAADGGLAEFIVQEPNDSMLY